MDVCKCFQNLNHRHWTCKAQRKSSNGKKFEAEWFLDLSKVQLVDIRCDLHSIHVQVQG